LTRRTRGTVRYQVAGLLDEETVLKPLFLKLVETAHNTVAFSSDTQEAQAIMEASTKEQAATEALYQQQEQDGSSTLAADDRMDLSSDLNKSYTGGSHSSVKERAKYIPFRLSLGKRKMLRLVEASMVCCDYTTEVDRSFQRNNNNNSSRAMSARRTHEQLRGVTAVLRGLVTARDYSAGQTLLEHDNFGRYQPFFIQMFEIARRHKIMNPEKRRTEYGRLVYLLQDAVSPTVQPHLGCNVTGPIQSVTTFLESRDALLSDPLIETATEESWSAHISPAPKLTRKFAARNGPCNNSRNGTGRQCRGQSPFVVSHLRQRFVSQQQSRAD
jgi:hypothetical protein